MAGTRLCLVVFGCLAACGGSSKDELKITDVSVGSAQQSNGFMVTQMSMTVGSESLPPRRIEATLSQGMTRGDGDAVLTIRDNSGPAQPLAYRFDPVFAQASIDTVSGPISFGLAAGGLYTYGAAQYADPDALARSMAGDKKITATPVYSLAAAQYALENNPSGTLLDRSLNITALRDVARRLGCYRMADYFGWSRLPSGSLRRPVCRSF